MWSTPRSFPPSHLRRITDLPTVFANELPTGHGHYTHCKNIVFYAPIDEHSPRYPEWILDLCIFGAITGLYFGRLLHREHSKVTRNQLGRHLQSCPWRRGSSMKFASWSMKSCFVGSTSDNFQSFVGGPIFELGLFYYDSWWCEIRKNWGWPILLVSCRYPGYPHPCHYGKSLFIMGKSTINGHVQ